MFQCGDAHEKLPKFSVQKTGHRDSKVDFESSNNAAGTTNSQVITREDRSDSTRRHRQRMKNNVSESIFC